MSSIIFFSPYTPRIKQTKTKTKIIISHVKLRLKEQYIPKNVSFFFKNIGLKQNNKNPFGNKFVCIFSIPRKQ